MEQVYCCVPKSNAGIASTDLKIEEVRDFMRQGAELKIIANI